MLAVTSSPEVNEVGSSEVNRATAICAPAEDLAAFQQETFSVPLTVNVSLIISF